MTLTLDAAPLASYRSVAIAEDWIRGRVVLRTITIAAPEIRAVSLFADDLGGEFVIIGASVMRSVAVPVEALTGDPALHDALRRLVDRAAAGGARVDSAAVTVLSR